MRIEDARRWPDICPAHPRWSNGSEEWRHVPEAFRRELRLPRWEPEQYVAIAFQICGFLRERRIDTGNKQRERQVLRLPRASRPGAGRAGLVGSRVRLRLCRLFGPRCSLVVLPGRYALALLAGGGRHVRARRLLPSEPARSAQPAVDQAWPRPVCGREPPRAGDRVLWLRHAGRLAHAAQRQRPFAASLRAGAQKLLGSETASRPASRQPHEPILSARWCPFFVNSPRSCWSARNTGCCRYSSSWPYSADSSC